MGVLSSAPLPGEKKSEERNGPSGTLRYWWVRKAARKVGVPAPGCVYSGIKLNAALQTPEPSTEYIEWVHRQPAIRELDAVTKSTPPRANTHAGIIYSGELSGAELREFMAAGRWHMRKAGATGNSVGRPAAGLRKTDALKAKIGNVVPLAEAVASIKAGRHRTPEQKKVYDRLALWAHREGRAVNKASLASALECSRDTAYELVKRGKEVETMHEERIARLEEALAEIGQLGIRLAQMFPTNPMVTAAVDRLLADVFGEAQELAEAA